MPTRADNLYGRMTVLGKNMCYLLSEAISMQVGYPVARALVHDGTAADTAVITIRVALGTGFSPPQHGLRQLDSHFTI